MTRVTRTVALSQISHAPRKFMMRQPSEEAISDIAESIKSRTASGLPALIQLPTLYSAASLGLDDHPTPYVVAVGNTRTMALTRCGITEYEFHVEEDGSLSKFMQDVYSENMDRHDATPVDEALFLSRMFAHGKFKDQGSFAAALRLHPSSLSRKLSLVDAPDDLLEMLRFGVLDLNHAYDLLSRTKGSRRVLTRILRYLTANLVEEPTRKVYRDGEERVQQRIHMTVQQLRRHIDMEMIGYTPEKEARLAALAEEIVELAAFHGLPVTEDMPEYPESVSVEDALSLNINPVAGGSRYLDGVGLQVSESQQRITVTQADAQKMTADLNRLRQETSGEGSEKFDTEPTDDDFDEKTDTEDGPVNPYDEPEETRTEEADLNVDAILKLSATAAARMTVLNAIGMITIHGGPHRTAQLARLLHGRVDGSIVSAIEFGRTDQLPSLAIKSFELPIIGALCSMVMSDMADRYGVRWPRQTVASILVSGEPDAPESGAEQAPDSD
ncbi:hypothetical protein IHN63_00390 [Deinococcus sp. 6YEL10]|uniref:ParB/RepB/Spo0J family partition protein n=1 Tax=Deinococcus sp. 6YEL10 TaxID=2745870 RepID=UPI001E579E39|nr:hypothetical protein [Deinococcus sp. 6YEL10]MCD0159757.1 hypothetical protein [Deinococcus sp. 6YEL10]